MGNQAKQFCLVHGLEDTHIRTGEDYDAITWQGIVKTAMAPLAMDKHSADAIIASLYRGHDARDHKAQADKGEFHIIPVDIDSGNHTIDDVDAIVVRIFGDVARLIYATKSSTDADKRWRVFVPVKTAIPGADFIDTQNAVASLLSDHGLTSDKAMSRTGQVSFLPNKGEHYEHKTGKSPILGSVGDINGLTDRIAQIEADNARAAKEALENAKRNAEARRQREATGELSPIEWFNENNSITAMIADNGWIPMGPGRGFTWWASPYSKSQGRSVRCYESEGRCVSFTGSDVGKLGRETAKKHTTYDAFDVYVARQHGGNEDAALRAIREMMGRDKMHQEFEPIKTCETGEDAGFISIDAAAKDVTPAEPKTQETTPAVQFNNAPMDIFSETKAPRFDLSVMPRPIQDFVAVNRPAMGAPESLMAMAALGACMAAVDKRISIKPQQSTGWRENPVLWLMGVGDPSVKKSPVRNLAFREITNIEKQSAREASQKQRRYELQMKIYKKEESAFVKEVTQGAASMEDAPEMPIRPEGMRYTVETTTIEALMRTASNNPAGLVLNSDELSGWFGSMDAYSANKGGASKDRPLWLQAFNSQPTTIDRVGGGQVTVENFAVGIVGFVQPDALRGALKNLPVDGLLQRFIPFHGADAVLSQDVPADAMGDFDMLVGNIRLIQDAQSIEIEPSTEARNAINELWGGTLFPLLQYSGIPSPTRNHIAKLEGALWRIALLFHIIETTHARTSLQSNVSLETAQRACDFVRSYIAPSILHLHDGVLGKTGNNDVVSAVARWILAHDIKGFTIRDVTRGVRAFQKLESDYEKLQVMRQLEDSGWVASNPGELRHLPREWMAHPNANAAFAEIAKQEKERRIDIVAKLNELRKAK